MTNNLQSSFTRFFTEAKLIEGAEDAVLELSDECRNCIMLSGQIYGKDTHEKINAIGRKYGLLVLARELSVLYEKP